MWLVRGEYEAVCEASPIDRYVSPSVAESEASSADLASTLVLLGECYLTEAAKPLLLPVDKRQ